MRMVENAQLARAPAKAVDIGKPTPDAASGGPGGAGGGVRMQAAVVGVEDVWHGRITRAAIRMIGMVVIIKLFLPLRCENRGEDGAAGGRESPDVLAHDVRDAGRSKTVRLRGQGCSLRKLASVVGRPVTDVRAGGD